MKYEELRETELAVCDVIAPWRPEFSERFVIFEWGHETTPTEDEICRLCVDIAEAVNSWHRAQW